MNNNSLGIFELLFAMASRAGLGSDPEIQEIIEAASLSGDESIISDTAEYFGAEAIEEILQDVTGLGKPSPEDVEGPLRFGNEVRTNLPCGLDLKQDAPIVITGVTQRGKTTLLRHIIRYCLEY